MVISCSGLLVALMVLASIGGLMYVQIRRRLKVQPKANWVIVEAIVQPGGLGRIAMAREGSSYPACFLGYGFAAQGMRRAGLFALYGDLGDRRNGEQQPSG